MYRWFITSAILLVFWGMVAGQWLFPIYAKECNEGDPQLDSICRQLNKANEEYQQLLNAIGGVQKSLSYLESQINGIKATLVQIRREVKVKEKNIQTAEGELSAQKELLSARIKSLYMQSRRISPYLFLLSSSDLGQAIRQVQYVKTMGEQDEKVIVSVSGQISTLKQEKESLENKTAQLGALESNLDKQAASLRKDIQSAQNYQKTLDQKIADLTAQQQRILAEKTGSFQTSVGETPLSDDPCSGAPGADNFCSPSFSPAFGIFSFGAPHRKGMSQYGAYGRAKSGQNYESILKTYYGDIRLETVSLGSIGTSAGTLPFEENYLMGIAEMPSSWGDKGGMEALKAQAIAARTYALAYVGWRLNDRSVKGSICTSESCQVYSASKAGNVPDAWRRAVEETRGKVVVSNRTGEIFATWYASTAGGYFYSYDSVNHSTVSGWDSVCGDQGCWPDQAYEKVGGSPWFYKGWYRTREGKNCNRNNPWLNQEEFADIVNSALVNKNDGGAIVHLSQTDGCFGNVPDTWSKEKVREEAAKYGGPVNNITSVSVIYNNGGFTQEIKIGTDKGELSFNGDDFKEIFNLRAPGAIHLMSRLYNLVRI